MKEEVAGVLHPVWAPPLLVPERAPQQTALSLTRPYGYESCCSSTEWGCCCSHCGWPCMVGGCRVAVDRKNIPLMPGTPSCLFGSGFWITQGAP